MPRRLADSPPRFGTLLDSFDQSKRGRGIVGGNVVVNPLPDLGELPS
jgi:hypothetical protein